MLNRGNMEDFVNETQKLLGEWNKPYVSTKCGVDWQLFENSFLTFRIGSHAPRRKLLQDKLREIFKDRQRDYRLAPYYNWLSVVCRRRCCVIDDLKADHAALQDLLRDIEKELQKEMQMPSAVYKIPVGIDNVGVDELLGMALCIPDYQRAYCWGKGNIIGLLEDIARWQKSHNGKPYGIGTVVLKRISGGAFDVIDGQQRIVTLAILSSSLLTEKDIKEGTAPFNIRLGSTNQTKEAKETIWNADRLVREWVEIHKDVRIDLGKTELGVIVIGEEESDDLAFNFFNHLNSSGVPLTDYELLKGHHLRYVKDDGVAQVMARRWHKLESGCIKNEQELLLHRCLFRIRKWLSKESFRANADQDCNSRPVFKEFSLGFVPLTGFCTSFKAFDIDSLLSGGIEFFDYVERYRRLFELFVETPAVKAIESLRWHSYGTLYDGVLALSFMFYCKFGDVYLNEAAYAIAWNVSRLRKETRVQRDYIGSDKGKVFYDTAAAISRATHESEALGKILNRADVYLKNSNPGTTARNYWKTLREVAEKLQGEDSKLRNEGLAFIHDLKEAKK